MAIKEDLAKIIGKSNVSDDEKTLESYAGDQSFVTRIKPACVAKPKAGAEVEKIVAWANETGTPLVPVSSGAPHFRGDTVPSVGGAVIVDLSGMKKIVRVDRRNRVAMIEPGVTYGELILALAKEGLAAHMPLVPRSTKSVIGSVLEREPITMPRHHWDASDPMLCIEVVFGDGHLFRTGSAAGPGTLEEQWKVKRAQIRPMGPAQTDFQRVVQGSQGTMGIVNWMSLKCRILATQKSSFLIPANDLEDLTNLSFRLQRVLLGDDCLILNRHNLASLLADDKRSIADLEAVLPPWLMFVSAEGRGVLPEEKVAYQVNDMKKLAQSLGLTVKDVVGGIAADEVAQVLSQPSKEPYWKFKAKGNCRDLFFLTTTDKTPEFVKAMNCQAENRGISPNDIGVYIQPTVNGTSCHCEFNINCDSNNRTEMEKVKGLVSEGSAAFANLGAYFSRPYGPWADVAYRRDAESTAFLRKVKTIFDPNKIMNPGKLCF